jgi:hypothetical protein
MSFRYVELKKKEENFKEEGSSHSNGLQIADQIDEVPPQRKEELISSAIFPGTLTFLETPL